MKKHVSTISTVIYSLAWSLLAFSPTVLAKKIIIPETDLPGPSEASQATDLTTFFNENVFGNLTQIIISFAGIAAFIFAIISGVRMLTAYGNEDTYGTSKKMFMISLVGFLIAMLSYTLVSIIGNLQF